MAYIYAKINKDTLKFIRERKQISFEYIERTTKYKHDKLDEWENVSASRYPTIKQAKELAKCYRVPFAGFYMNSEDINVSHLPKLINKRTMTESLNDESAVNLAIFDLLGDREFYIETKKELKESIPLFDLMISEDLSVADWAKVIREYFDINLSEQYRISSKRKFYLYLRNKIETKGIFVQGFQKVNVDVLRGVAIVDELMPIIGVNNNDRYPAKSFSIIHELVHVIKRNSSICNDMFDSSSEDREEIFCNAVAGELLVPKDSLDAVLRRYAEITLEDIDSIANKFSVSSEVIARRIYDCGKKSLDWYKAVRFALGMRLQQEKEKQKENIKNGVTIGPRRNMAMEAIDNTSTFMCNTLVKGVSTGLLDKSDVSAHIRINQKHVDKFISEVLSWQY